MPPKAENRTALHPAERKMQLASTDGLSPPASDQSRLGTYFLNSPDRSRSVPDIPFPPRSPGFRQGISSPLSDQFPSEGSTFLDKSSQDDSQNHVDHTIGAGPHVLPEAPLSPVPYSPDTIGPPASFLRPSTSAPAAESGQPFKSDLVSPTAPLEKRRSRWRTKLTMSRKESTAASGDSSSLSSSTLESQKLEEVSLDSLLRASKAAVRAKFAKNVNVCLSQNSTLALIWTQPLVHIWDVGSSPPTMVRSIMTQSSCVLAAVTKVHLAYVIGTRDQKLTVSHLTITT